MTSRFSRFLMTKVLGWTLEDEVAPEDRCIILAAPHTSIWDFVIGYAYYRAIGGHLRIMIKKEMFVFPLNLILKAMGGFPIDRGNPQKMLMSIIHEMNSGKPGEKFHLVICPEGTRKAIRKWKTGYHLIATECNIPIYLSHFDYRKKTIGRGPRFELKGTPREDTDRLQKVYEDMQLTARHPEGFATH